MRWGLRGGWGGEPAFSGFCSRHVLALSRFSSSNWSFGETWFHSVGKVLSVRVPWGMTTPPLYRPEVSSCPLLAAWVL